jgi:DNA gyrase subunit B
MTIGNIIKKLTPYEHVRKRTSMYFSSTEIHTQYVIVYENNNPKIIELSWIPAISILYREIIDNSLDEIVGHGFGNKIDFTFDAQNMIFCIEDNGRGIPIDFDKTNKMHKVTLALSNIMAGRNFDERGETAGVNGIGASGVNFCSEYFTVDVWRDSQHFHQEFKENMFGNQLDIGKPKIKPYSGNKTGTRIEFKISQEVFKQMILPEIFVKSRIYEIAMINPKIKFTYNGEKISSKEKWENHLFENAIIIDVVKDKFSSKFVIVPDFCETEHVHSVVNNIFVLNGGVHVEQFKKNFYSKLLDSLEKENKKRNLVPNISDISQNILLYNVTKMNAPTFDSQSKSRLINDEIKKIFQDFFSNEEFFKSFIKSNKEFIDKIYERCEERTTAKEKKDVEKLAKKNNRTKIADLQDACGKDRTKCNLLITEGLSAASGISAGRESADIYGSLPLRGKPMNVREEAASTVLKNEVLSKVMGAIGLVPGQRPNRRLLRYGRIYITTDADEDGKNIAALVVNFFYTFWKELFDSNLPPFIYIFDTPLIIAVKGKTRKFWYNDNIEDFNGDDYKGWEITRAKGLAALKKEDWKQILLAPKLIPIIDDGKLDESLDLLFNKKSSDKRKVWIGM